MVNYLWGDTAVIKSCYLCNANSHVSLEINCFTNNSLTPYYSKAAVCADELELCLTCFGHKRCAPSSYCTQRKSRNPLTFLLISDFHTPPILSGLLNSPACFQAGRDQVHSKH